MLKTEMRNPKSMSLNKMDTLSQVRLMNEENANAVKALESEFEQIALAADEITMAFKNGGRLFYIGAGTSGRLGVLDAAECPPTFGVSNDLVIGIIAGGDSSLRKASENAEDIGDAGVTDLKSYNVNGKDVVVGISAAGGAAYVVNALEYAKSLGCKTVGVTSNKGSKLDQTADISICTDTGAEVVTGSTRLKAGTAQKLVLNMLSTLAMVNSGYVYENMMINLKPTNIKLRNRVIRIACEILSCDEEEAVRKLDHHNWVLAELVKYIDD